MGCGGDGGEGVYVGGCGDGDDAVECAEVGGESAVVLRGMQDKFGEPLDRMRRIGGEVGVEVLLDRREQRQKLWRQGASGKGNACGLRGADMSGGDGRVRH